MTVDDFLPLEPTGRLERAELRGDLPGALRYAAIRAEVDINVACSLGMLTQDQVNELAAMGVHRYNHNLETARSHFPTVVTTCGKYDRAVSRLWL